MSTQNLTEDEALLKMRTLVNDINTCLMCTRLMDIPFEARPMTTMEVDEQGYIWFFSEFGSHKISEILEDPRMQLLYADPAKAHFINLYGTAVVLKDRQKTQELYSIYTKNWFQKGKDDPSLTLIRFKPESAHYWDNKDGKVLSTLKMIFSKVLKKNVSGHFDGELRDIREKDEEGK